MKSWDEIRDVADSVLDRSKLKCAKKRVQQATKPHGHSLEAVANRRARLIEIDPYYIYKLNDNNMNGEATYVFKMSKVQQGVHSFSVPKFQPIS